MYANFTVMTLERGTKHPHKLLISPQGIQSVIDRIRTMEEMGITCQAAHLMQELVRLHPFAGGNHRTAYVIAGVFLLRNGRHFKTDRFEDAYLFIRDVGSKSIQEIQKWIEHGSAEES